MDSQPIPRRRINDEPKPDSQPSLGRDKNIRNGRALLRIFRRRAARQAEPAADLSPSVMTETAPSLAEAPKHLPTSQDDRRYDLQETMPREITPPEPLLSPSEDADLRRIAGPLPMEESNPPAESRIRPKGEKYKSYASMSYHDISDYDDFGL